MSLESVKKNLEKYNLEKRIFKLKSSGATVEKAAQTIGVRPEQIAKTLAFSVKKHPFLVVTIGTAQIDNHKLKKIFGRRTHMIPIGNVEKITGHPIGGVCPFGLNPGIKTYLDSTLKKFNIFYPAAGNPNYAMKLFLSEINKYAFPESWISVSKE